MYKKLTIDIDEKIYNGLYAVIGAKKISQFLENLVRPYVIPSDLEVAYKNMALDREREQEADEWCEGLVGDTWDEKR